MTWADPTGQIGPTDWPHIPDPAQVLKWLEQMLSAVQSWSGWIACHVQYPSWTDHSGWPGIVCWANPACTSHAVWVKSKTYGQHQGPDVRTQQDGCDLQTISLTPLLQNICGSAKGRSVPDCIVQRIFEK